MGFSEYSSRKRSTKFIKHCSVVGLICVKRQNNFGIFSLKLFLIFVILVGGQHESKYWGSLGKMGPVPLGKHIGKLLSELSFLAC